MTPPMTRPQRKPSVTGDAPRVEQRLNSRRLRWSIIALLVFAGIFFLSPTKSREKVTDLRLFHHTPIHKPPTQKNSTSGDVRWFNDWKWLKPFSASVTHDEDRSVLPPLQSRPPIYTFYDSEAEKDEKIRTAENRLLLIWRRAWWAQGFRPQVLGRPEAMSHPYYEGFQSKKLPKQLQEDLIRWLAFGQMGTGILANWLCLPMGPRDDHLLSHLRRGEYPKLTRYEALDSGLFSGNEQDINAAIKETLDSDKLKDHKSLIDIVPANQISVDQKPSAITFYDANKIADLYKPIGDKLKDKKADALGSLADEQSHMVTQAAHALADALRTCLSTPIADSCPPNVPSCKSCSSKSSFSISTPPNYENNSDIFEIGTVPHPYTFASLLSKTKELTVRHIRRDTARDRWLGAVTQKLLGEEMGGPSRLSPFKEIVAGTKQTGHGFWMIDDPIPMRKDLEYHFGFPLPLYNETNINVVTAPKTQEGQEVPKKEQKAKEKELQHQRELLSAARELVGRKRKKKEKAGMKGIVEAWNLADTEAWRFVRALRTRETVERTKWEQEERRFAGGEETEGGWRWFDRRRGGNA